MGPYTQLLIRRTDSDRAITVKVLEATAERLGWLEAFPTVWEPAAAPVSGKIPRPGGFGSHYPSEGGIPSGAYLASKTYRKGAHPRLRFRVTGPWTRSDLNALREATVPDLHALTAGGLRWCRLQA